MNDDALYDTIFPNNVVNVLAEQIALVDLDYIVVKRPVRDTDEHGTVGVFEAELEPVDKEIGTHGLSALSKYTFVIQTQVVEADPEVARRLSNYMAKTIRLMLSTDATLRARLAGLVDTTMGVRETTQKWEMRSQGFVPLEMNDTLYYVSNTVIWFYTHSRVV